MIDIKELVKINLEAISFDTIFRYKSIKNLCKLKYPRHNKGCPNYLKCKDIPFFDDIDEVKNRNIYYLLIANFDYKKYQELRKLDNPNLTNNQVRCVLYWQNSVKKLLKIELEKFKDKDVYVLGCGSGFKLSYQNQVYSMESVGINVFKTLHYNNIKFDVKAVNNVKLVCLVCSNDILGNKKLIYK